MELNLSRMETPRKEVPGLSRRHEDCRGLRGVALEDFIELSKEAKGNGRG